MRIARPKLTFGEWITFIFDHTVSEPAWYWNETWPELEHSQIVAYLTRLFSDAETLLPLSDAQASQGLNFLVSPSLSDYMFALEDKNVPLANRLPCIQSMAVLFERCFALRCAPELSFMN